MAGYALGFDDGGDVPEDESAGLDTSADARDDRRVNDNGMLPVRAAQNAYRQVRSAYQQRPEGTPMPDVGEAPDVAYETPGEFAQNQYDSTKAAMGRGVENLKNSAPGRGVKSIIAYLMGAGADHPQRVQQTVDQVKASDPSLSDDDANLLAVHQAGQQAGPAAAWAMLQYNRSAYNAKQAFARTALNGIDGKAGDISAAAQAATQAGSHVLDGSSAVFTAAPEGVTATVRGPDGNNQQYRLTPQQFNHYLDLGKTSQYDAVLRDGINGALQKATAQGAAPQDEEESDEQGTATPPATRGKNMGQTPSTMDLAPEEGPGLRGYKPMDYDAFADDKATSGARAAQLYPSISQGQQRRQYQASEQQREEELQNKIDVASEKGKNEIEKAKQTGFYRNQAADTTGQHNENRQKTRTQGNIDVANIQARARAQSDQQKALQFAQKLEQQGTDARMRERGRMARMEISNPNFLLQDDKTRNAILAKYGIQPQTPQAPTPQASPQTPVNNQAPQSRPANVPQGAKFYGGKWYVRGPDGKSAVEVQ